MTIEAQNIGKRFESQWIFRNISFSFESGNVYAITGKNGSGKSTLLKTVAAYLTPNEGTINYRKAQQNIVPEALASHISFSAPYMDLIEELSVGEMINFHAALRPLIISKHELSESVRIAEKTAISNLSSGMKQRLKLALAIYTQSQVVFLDEPTANFDSEWEQWYLNLIERHSANRLFVIASNHALEYQDFAKEVLTMKKIDG